MIGKVFIKNQRSAQAFTTLLLAQKVCAVDCLEVSRPIGEEAWQALGKALQGATRLGLRGVFVSKQGLSEAKEDDMKDIWDATVCGFQVVNFSTYRDEAVLVDKSEHDWDAAWMRLSQISDMTDDEFVTAFEEQQQEWKKRYEEAGDDSDEGEDSDEDEDSIEDENSIQDEDSIEEDGSEEGEDSDKEEDIDDEEKNEEEGDSEDKSGEEESGDEEVGGEKEGEEDNLV